jgi:hypothetical protein
VQTSLVPEFCYIFCLRHLLNYIYITADLSFLLFSIHLKSMHFLARRTGTETVPCGTPSWPRASVSGSARLSFSFWAFHSSIRRSLPMFPRKRQQPSSCERCDGDDMIGRKKVDRGRFFLDVVLSRKKSHETRKPLIEKETISAQV